MSREEQNNKTELPEHRRKLYVLVALAGLVIFLFWIWTLPLNFHGRDTNGQPTDLFGPIGDTVQQGREYSTSRESNE
jgi:hypothetical protein